MIKRSTFAALAALAMAAAPSGAQSITSPYDFVEHSQAFWAFGNATFADRGLLGLGPDGGYGAGFGYTVRISGPFNFDARVAYLASERTVYDILEGVDSAAVVQDPTTALDEIGTADLDLLVVDAALRFDVTGPRTWYRLQPYALIGAGGVLTLSSDNAVEQDLPDDVDLFVRFRDGFTGHVGGGVEWYASQRFTVRLDIRDILWRINVPAGFIRSGIVVDDREWVQTAHINLGASFRF